MNTKKYITSKVIMGCFSIMILASCDSREERTDEAFEKVKEDKMDTIGGVMPTKKSPEKTEPVKIVESMDEWAKFRLETEKKILANEKKIKEKKSIPNTDAKYFRKVASLEKNNNDLRRQLDEYQEDVKLRWFNFKEKMNHDVEGIDVELKGMIVETPK